MVIVSFLLTLTMIPLLISDGIYNSRDTEMNTVLGFVKKKKMSASWATNQPRVCP